MSDSLAILAAKLADAPVNLGDNTATTTAYQIALTWDDGSYNGGTPVIDYRVWYSVSGENNFVIFSDTVLTSDSIITSLTVGTTYDFYIEARNLVGYSPVSDTKSILAAQIADEITTLSDAPAVTTSTQIGLTWTAAAFDGGSDVIDYRVWYDSASSGVTFEVLAENILESTYTALSMDTGSTYQFKVQARNIYGFSINSINAVSILAAQKPDVPTAPITSFATDVVTITWTAPAT
jgi:hypothetical protein